MKINREAAKNALVDTALVGATAVWLILCAAAVLGFFLFIHWLTGIVGLWFAYSVAFVFIIFLFFIAFYFDNCLSEPRGRKE